MQLGAALLGPALPDSSDSRRLASLPSPGRPLLKKSATAELPGWTRPAESVSWGKVMRSQGGAISTGGVKTQRRKTRVRLASGCRLAHESKVPTLSVYP